jgi:replicative superfamily II helicase
MVFGEAAPESLLAEAMRALHVQVGLMVIDEIHLLGADRGPILEVSDGRRSSKG